MRTRLTLTICCSFDAVIPARADEPGEFGTHGFADFGGVKINYVTKGTGPLVVLIHGHPNSWYGWRHQMSALAERFQVVAIDLLDVSAARPGGWGSRDENV